MSLIPMTPTVGGEGHWRPTSYCDFIYQPRSIGNGEFGISVLSPAGEGEEKISSSALPKEWFHESPSRGMRDLPPAPPAGRRVVSPEAFGILLYKALFPGIIGSLFERSLEVAQARRVGLRLKIFLNPRDPEIRILQGIRWEMLYRDNPPGFLALSQQTPIIRSLPVARPARAINFPEQVRVLALLASPHDMAALDLQRELFGMNSEAQGRFEIVPRQAHLTEIRKTLAEGGPFHVLHFLGHGVFESEEGFLVFERLSGVHEAISGTAFAEKLCDSPTLQLIVLNACKTGLSPLTGSGNPFGGVAAALVQAGFPAVLAMQEAISDSAATKLSRQLYHYLARGQSVEVALTEARHAIRKDEGLAWVIPSLFLRTSAPLQFAPALIVGPVPLLVEATVARQRQDLLAEGLGIQVEIEVLGVRFRLLPSGKTQLSQLDAPLYLAVHPLTREQWYRVTREGPIGQSLEFQSNLSADDIEQFLHCAQSLMPAESALWLDFPSGSEWLFAASVGTTRPGVPSPLGFASLYGDVYQCCRAEEGDFEYELRGGSLGHQGSWPLLNIARPVRQAVRNPSVGFRPALRGPAHLGGGSVRR